MNTPLLIHKERGKPQCSSYTPAFVSISAGAAHTCAIDEDGYAHCWGNNGAKQSGDVSDPILTYPNMIEIF